jgi:uncharacterized protein (TIGR00369 family)
VSDLPPLNPAYLDELRASESLTPFRTFMGVRIEEIAYDRSLVTLDLREEHLQLRGTVAGGVMATLIDTATFWACFARIPADAGLANVDLRLNYLEAVPRSAGRLVCEGTVLRAGRRLNYAEAYVRDQDGRPVAHGTSSVLVLPGKGVASDLPKFL